MIDERHIASLHSLRLENQWPDMAKLADVEPFDWALGNQWSGRELICDVIRFSQAKIFVEVGAFMCGSTRLWLENCPGTLIICVDPWPASHAAYMRKVAADRKPWGATPEQLHKWANDIDAHGCKAIALNNIRNHHLRVIPVQRSVPEAYHYLAKMKVEPDIIYIDAMKRREEFTGAHEAFPNAIICGDDYTWADADGKCPVPGFVDEIARARKGRVLSSLQSWAILP